MRSSYRGKAGSLRLALYGAAAFFLVLAPLDAAGRQALSNHVPAAVATARRLGPMSRSARLNLTIGLPLRNQDALARLVSEVSDPASPSYRAWITAGEFAGRFGPSESDYAALIEFTESHGLTVSATHPNRMILDVSGPVSAIEDAFQVELTAWSDSARGSFYAPDREPSLDLDVPVLDITGLDNYVLPRPMSVQAMALTGSGPGGLLTGGDFRAAYAPGVKLTGAGQTIGLFELDGFYAADVAANFKAAGLSPVPVQTVLLDGSSGAPGSGNIEVMLDIMMAAYMAPGASKIVVYEGYNWNDILNRMATDNAASQLSCSWGFSPITATTEQIFRQMIVQGQSFFQASGDDGAYRGAIMPPSDDPNVTVVGGTHLTTSGPAGAWLSETAWSGSGGGVSRSYSIPSYQQGVNPAPVGGSTTMRNIPDVAAVADVQIFLIQNNGQAVQVGGTSAAAPLWAGFMALVNQSAAADGTGPVGFANPSIYAIGESAAASGLHDIVLGSNNGFSAAPGYDLTTGWGTPSGAALIDKLAGMRNSASFSLSAGLSAVSVTPGGAASTAIGVMPQNGFTGSVVLSASGLPAGVTAAFSPAASGPSTVTFSAASAAVPGTASVTIMGKSGSLTEAVVIAVTVTPVSGFTISVSPTAVGMAQGTSAKATIAVSAVGGFAGTVGLTVSGLPAGVGASITRGTVAGTSSMTLTATGAAAIGTTAVTISGTSGSQLKTAVLNLTVTAASTFSLSAAPAAVTVTQGGAVSSTIAVTPQNGFTGIVALNVSGLPSGVTASFAQNSLVIAASSSAAPGTAMATITGTSGTLAKTTAIAVTVVAAPSFSLSAAASTLNLTQGGSMNTLVSVVSLGGFTGKVSLTASGLPTGVSVSFGALSASGASTLTVAASASAAAGTSTLKVTGTSGSLTASTTVAISVLAPADYSITVNPGNLSIPQGTVGSATIRVAGVNGFAGILAFSVSGLPSGVTAVFSPAGTAGSSVLTLSVAKTAAKGTSTVSIAGKSGALSHSAPLALSVTAPASQ